MRFRGPTGPSTPVLVNRPSLGLYDGLNLAD
jgi:hypothetical protein